MSTDTSIRPITIAEQAEAAARRFVETGEPITNPHAGTEHEQKFRSLADRWCLALSAEVDTQGPA